MKLAYICNEYPPAPGGGIRTFVHTIAHGMKDAGHQVSVVGWGKTPGERDDGGIRVVTLPESKTRGIAWWVNRRRICRCLKREAASGNIDIVETPEFQGPLISTIGETPVVVRLHLSAAAIAKHAGKEMRGLTRFCEKRTLSLFRSWIAVSDYALELTKDTFALTAQKTVTIYCPVSPPGDTDPEVPNLPAWFVLYAGGTVSRRKGAYLLAEAARKFLSSHPDLHLVFIGPLETEEGIAADDRIWTLVGAELQSRLHFPGRLSRDAVLACMKRAAVFAYPSTLETFGLVTAEAMLQGCPVVVCDTGPCPEFIEHEKTGLLVTPNDTNALSAAVNRLLDNRVFSQRLADAGKEHIGNRFTLSRCVADTLSFYEKVIEEQE